MAERTTLLAWKPFIAFPLGDQEYRLAPASIPDFTWPTLTVVSMTCADGHKQPEETCNCGMLSYLAADKIATYYAGKFDVEFGIPLVGVVQVLGTTFIEKKVVRSWGQFLWGIVTPLEYNDAALIHWLHATYRPVIYTTLFEGATSVLRSLMNYNIMHVLEEV